MKVFPLKNPLLLLFFFVPAWAFAGNSTSLAQENGVLENTQIVFLFLSGLVFVMQSFRVERNDRFILWMGAWFCLSSILRELDVEDLAVPQWVIAIGSGLGRNLIMGLGWIVLCVLAIKSYPELKDSFGTLARSRTARFLYVAAIILLLGSLFDHGTVSSGQSKLWEEGLEVLGYFLLLPAAMFSPQISKG